MIDLEEVRLELPVDEDVEAQQLKARTATRVRRRARFVRVRQLRLNTQQGLQNDILNLRFEGAQVVSLTREIRIDVL